MREQPQQQFQYLGFRRFWPEPALTALLECFWSTGFGRGFVLSSLENVYPDGGCSLTIELTAHGPRATLQQNRVRGRRPFLTQAPCISARLHGGALYYLFGIAPVRLHAASADADADTDFSLLLQGPQLQSFRQLLARLDQLLDTAALQASQPDELAALHALEQWLLRCAADATDAKARHNRPDHSLSALQLLAGSEHNVSATAQALGISSRTLERQLQLQVGFSPQYYQLCQRMKSARQQLALTQTPLVDVALQCGFYDQAHFSHAFSRFVGETPAAYRQRKKTSR